MNNSCMVGKMGCFFLGILYSILIICTLPTLSYKILAIGNGVHLYSIFYSMTET